MDDTPLAELVISDQWHYVNVMHFARKVGKDGDLDKKLTRLRSGGGTLRLYPDFAPFSFSFVREYSNGLSVSGGLIYHGPLDDGRRAETLAVTLSPTDTWEIHT